MKMIEVTQLVDDPATDFVFEAELMDSYKYKVTLSKDYYQKLTDGKIDATELIEKSFEFLLKREPASSILPEFDLTQINDYFPEYEEEIKTQIGNTWLVK